MLSAGMQNGTAALKNSLAVSYKVTHTLTIRPSHFTARYLSKKNENICLHKDLDMNSNTIHKNQRLGRTRMSIASKGIKELECLHTMGFCLATQREVC